MYTIFQLMYHHPDGIIVALWNSSDYSPTPTLSPLIVTRRRASYGRDIRLTANEFRTYKTYL